MTTAFEPIALNPGARVRILPSGVFRTNDGRPERVAGWVMTAQIANRLIQERACSPNNGLIDYEHQSLTETAAGVSVPPAGWFRSLEWIEGEGLFMSGITWTPQASRMIGGLEVRHISPVFRFDAVTGEVLSLVSVALTNQPALDGLADLATVSAVQSTGRG